MNKVNEWKADLEACLAPAVAAAAAAVASPASNPVACPPLPLPSSAAVEALEARYKELECIVPDHKRIEPLLRRFTKDGGNATNPGQSSSCALQGGQSRMLSLRRRLRPLPPPVSLSNANLSIPIKRVKSDDVILPVSSKTASDRRRRSVQRMRPPPFAACGRQKNRERLREESGGGRV